MISKTARIRSGGGGAAALALALLVVLAGCPTTWEDLPNEEELPSLEQPPEVPEQVTVQVETGSLYAHDGSPRGFNGGRGSVGDCADDINMENDNQGWLELTLPITVVRAAYAVKFRYATGDPAHPFFVKFQIKPKPASAEPGDATQFGNPLQTNVGVLNNWDFLSSHDLVEISGITLGAGDVLKIWTNTWGAIDYVILDPIP